MAGDGITIRVRGLPAVMVLAGVLAFGAWRYVAAHQTIDSGARAQIQVQLTARYVKRAVGNVSQGSLSAENVQEMLKAGRVEIRSLRARGSPDEMIARVEATVDGQVPPDGESVTYWRLSHSSLLGWRVERSATALDWWLALL